MIDDHAERIPRYQLFPPPRDIIPASGVLYAATQGTRERSGLIANQVVGAMVEIARRELASPRDARRACNRPLAVQGLPC